MNRTLDSLARGPLAIAAVLAVSLAILWLLIGQGVTRFIVPPPENVGQLFFTSLKAHNFQSAHDHLSEDLRQQVAVSDLQQMTERLEQAAQRIEQASGESSQTQDASATAEIKLTMQDGTERTVAVPFTQENGLWQISSLAPLEALVGAP
jgi:hypothetical protein